MWPMTYLQRWNPQASHKGKISALVSLLWSHPSSLQKARDDQIWYIPVSKLRLEQPYRAEAVEADGHELGGNNPSVAIASTRDNQSLVLDTNLASCAVNPNARGSTSGWVLHLLQSADMEGTWLSAQDRRRSISTWAACLLKPPQIMYATTAALSDWTLRKVLQLHRPMQ